MAVFSVLGFFAPSAEEALLACWGAYSWARLSPAPSPASEGKSFRERDRERYLMPSRPCHRQVAAVLVSDVVRALPFLGFALGTSSSMVLPDRAEHTSGSLLYFADAAGGGGLGGGGRGE